MVGPALCALVYGALMIAGGVFAFRRVGSGPSLAGGGVTGGLATLGGVMMLAGSPAGRGLAVLGAVLAALFFGYSLSRAMLTQQKVGRPAGLLGLSIATVVVLLWTG